MGDTFGNHAPIKIGQAWSKDKDRRDVFDSWHIDMFFMAGFSFYISAF